MTVWFAVLAAGIVSYVLRVLPLVLGSRVHPSEQAQAGLRHAGMGAITALLVLGIVGILQPAAGLPVLPVVVALGVAAVCAGLGRSMLVTVVAGVGAYGAALLVTGPILLGQ
ncbi:AzlD domain-containing protein [Intrasporangium sp.]|uniref:AzlD domain-containing protein n=1 Tax=Intrasporangium sp. TaxID=1925024 RepID=UPI002939BC18|nr:AzlD domain-containing protein [Intrasporangium sp.]MDV3222774.1 AzlD domain-containing protein [Intrasporangium sp.]